MKIRRHLYCNCSNRRSCMEARAYNLHSNRLWTSQNRSKWLYRKYLCGCNNNLHLKLWPKATFSRSKSSNKLPHHNSHHRKWRMILWQIMLRSSLRKKRARRTIVLVSIPKDTIIAQVKHLNNKSMRNRCQLPKSWATMLPYKLPLLLKSNVNSGRSKMSQQIRMSQSLAERG